MINGRQSDGRIVPKKAERPEKRLGKLEGSREEEPCLWGSLPCKELIADEGICHTQTME
jgi:hypothetical protein